MGSTPSKRKKYDEQLEFDEYIDKTFCILHKIHTPFRGGQGKVHHGFDHVYIEKKYLVCGKMHISLKNKPENSWKREILRQLDLDPGSDCVLYLLCDVRKPNTQALQDPPCIKHFNNTKWILQRDLKDCFSNIKHNVMI